MANDLSYFINNNEIRECLGRMQTGIEDAVGKIKKYDKKVILEKGEAHQFEPIFYLESGKLALCLNDPRGDTITVLYHTPGQLVNFMPILAQCFPMDAGVIREKIPSDMFSIKALTTCVLYAVDNTWFVENLIKNNSLNAIILYSCVINLVSMYARTYNSPILSNSQRICRMIIEHARRNSSASIPIYLTHNEISKHLSIHPITVSKIFGRLRNLGIISKKDGSLNIENFNRLQAIADGIENISY